MVFKTGKRGIINTGHTVRYSHTLKHRDTRATLQKLILNNNYTVDERKAAGEEFQEYLDDGNLTASFSLDRFHFWRIDDRMIYSLNKKKRWMLVDQLKSVIDSDVEEEDFRVVLYERVSTDSEKNTWPDCFAYHDSKITDPYMQEITYDYNNNGPNKFSHPEIKRHRHRYPERNKYSFLTDLRLRHHPRVQDKQGYKKVKAKYAKERKKFHNQHFRGVQRKYNTPDFVTETNEERIRVISGQPEDSDLDFPEIRYDVCYPRKPVASGDPRIYKGDAEENGRYRYTRPVMFHGRFTDPHHAKSKLKGRRSKPWADEYYRGGCRKYIKECVNERHSLETDYEESNADENYENVRNSRDENYSLNLVDFICSKCPKKKKTTQIKESVSSHPNAAMVTGTKYYGKDMVIYSNDLKKDEHIETDNMADSEIVEGLSDLVLQETTETDVPLHESFIDCCICHESIKIALQNGCCGRTIQTSMCQPARHLIHLARETTERDTQMSYSLLILPKISLITDTGANNYRIRLQDSFGKSTHSSILLKDVIGAKPSHMFNLQELILLAEEILADHEKFEFQSKYMKNNKSMTWSDFVSLEHELNPVLRLWESQIDVKSVYEVHTEITCEEDNSETSFEVIYMEEIYKDIIEVPDYCDICVIPIDDAAIETTSMLPCQHMFCNQCWLNYILERIRNGDECIPCLGYHCEEMLDDLTIMSFVSNDMFVQWKQRIQENAVEKTGEWKWCPQNSCKHLARVTCDKNFQFGGRLVRCKCSTSWCFDCQQDDHWPATCDQSQVYTKMLEQNGDESGKSRDPSKTYYVNVKKCPNCKHPMEKNGGCSHMTCRCKHHFCWECLESWDYHTMNGLQCAGKIGEITMELDNSVQYPLPLKFYKRSVEHRFKWKSLGSEKIQKQVFTLDAQRGARTFRRKYGTRRINFYEPSQELIKYFIHIKQAHQILENLMVVMSNLTRKNPNRFLEGLIIQTEFCLMRQEQIFDQRKLSDNDLKRISILNKSMWICLEKMIILLPYLQKKIVDSKQKILGKPISTFENWK